jgi:iron complex outermembrane recepter protein
MRWLFLLTAAFPAMASAQQAAPPPTPEPVEQAESDLSDEPEEIVVTGSRTLPGSVVGDIPPEEQLGPSDIRSYGVNSVAELLSELSPQTRSGRGPGGAPVVLLNGRRISGFSEIRDLPTEAIARVDILPEEVALKYGFRADQRVVNFVLRQRFRALTAELADRITTRGDRNQVQAELDLLTIRRDRRVNLHSSYQESAALLEAQRTILSNTVGGVDQSPFRTLLGFNRQLSVNGSYARTIFGNVGATVNARAEATQGRGLQGLPIVGGVAIDALGPLRQSTSGTNGHLGATFNGDVGRWRWNVTASYDDIVSVTRNQTGLDANLTRLPDNFGRSRSTAAGLDAQANGTLFRLPAGDAAASLAVGLDTTDFASRSVRAGVAQRGQVSRDTASGRINLDLPLTSRSRNVGAALGTLSVNVNAAVNELSDFGTLTTLGYGANWAPRDGVRLILSVTDQENAPTAQQLGNPVIVTPNIRLFDFVTGTTPLLTVVTGGNPALRASSAHTAKLGLTLKPWSSRDLTFIANYVRASVDNPVNGFPAATAQIAAAFPDRFVRDPAGQLLQVDTRPVNFARSERSELRYGFNLSVPLKSEIQKRVEAFRNGTGPNPFEGLRPPGSRRAERPDGAGPPGGAAQGGFRGGGFGGRGGGFGGRGGGGGRLQFALYHTWRLTERVLVAQGGPRLDLLNGDAIGTGGGQPRHELEGQAGYSNNGLGARLSVNFVSGTQVIGGTPAAPQRLDFGSLTTANLRLFADPSGNLDLLRRNPWLRGARVTLSIDNIFDVRQRVTDQTGAVPVNFQPDLINPLGRTVRLAFRKPFF